MRQSVKHDTPDKLKFKKLTRRLKLSEREAIGILELLWRATAKNCPQGDIGRFTNEDIATLCDWPGEADKLVEALVELRWLDVCDERRLLVHDWREHCPNHVKLNSDKYNKPFFVAVARRSCEPSHDSSHEPLPSLTIPNHTVPDQTFCGEHASLSSPQSENAAPAAAECEPGHQGAKSLDAADPAAECQDDVPGVVMRFPAVGKGPTEWPLTEAKLAEYQQAFPDLNVLAQLRVARQWCFDTPKKRKTFGGYPAFCTRWLNNAQNRGTAYGPPPAGERRAGYDAAFEQAAADRQRFFRGQVDP